MFANDKRKLIQGLMGGASDYLICFAATNSLSCPIYQSKGNDINLLTSLTLASGINSTCSKFTRDGKVLVVGVLTSPLLYVFTVSNGVFSPVSAPSTLPTNTVNGLSFSPDGSFLCVAHQTSPFISIYDNVNGALTKLPNPASLPAGNGSCAAWSEDGVYLYVGTVAASPYFCFYKRSGSTFTKLTNPATMPPNNVNAIAVSRTSNHIAVAYTASNVGSVLIYTQTGDVLTHITTLAPGMTQIDDMRFSPDGKYLAISHNGTGGLVIYSRSGSTFTQLNISSILPLSPGQSVTFSEDGKMMFVSCEVSPYLTAYKINSVTDTFTKTNNPSTTPSTYSDKIGTT